MPDLPARRTLLDRPQRLGFLPTLWFWNDRGRQRLLMPLLVMIAVPLSPLFFFLMVWLQLPMWTLLLAGTVWPQLVCGLVKRRIRGELRRRALGASPHALARFSPTAANRGATRTAPTAASPKLRAHETRLNLSLTRSK